MLMSLEKSLGNTPCSKGFLKQLIQSGTRIPIESVLRLFNEKLIIIMELFIICVIYVYYYQQCAQGVSLSAYKSTLHTCVLEPPIKSIALLKASPRNASGAAVFHCCLSQST